MVLLLTALACAPSEEQVAHLVLQGELEQVEAAGLAPWSAWAGELVGRRDLRAHALRAEGTWTLARATTAMAELQWDDALTASTAGLALARVSEVDPAPFQAVADAALDACPHAGCRAEVHARLAETADRSGWVRHRELALRQAALGRYRASSAPASQGACAGVDRAMARAALELAAAEYLEDPPPNVIAEGALARLELLTGDAGVCGVLGCSPVTLARPRGASLAVALDAVEAGIDQTAAAGLPEEVASCEAVDGALSALDPHSAAVWPAQLAGWEDHHAGVVVGVGLRLRVADDGSLVTEVPTLGSPAFEAGVHRGDHLVRLASEALVVEVDEVDAELRATAVNAALVGPPGSALGVDVLRGGASLHFDLERRAVPMELLTGVTRGPDNEWRWWLDADEQLAYVRVESFKERTDDELDAILESLGEVRGVLLDVRGNGGGDLGAALEIADRWVADGIVAAMEGRGAMPPPEDTNLAPWNAALPGHALEGVPVVVLVDGETASAAEVVAGALQERAGAVVVGEHTWGKGLAQGLRTHPLGFALEVTNGRVTLPSGRPLDRSGEPWGVEPDLALALSPLEGLQLALEREEAGAVRAHADGSPVAWEQPLDMHDVPVAEGDPQRDLGELVLRALVVLESTRG